MHLSTQRKHIYDPVKHPNILSDIRCFLLNFLPLSFFISNGNFEEVFRSCAFNFEKIEFSLSLSMIILKKKRDSLHATLDSHYKAWSYKKKTHRKIKAYSKSL